MGLKFWTSAYNLLNVSYRGRKRVSITLDTFFNWSRKHLFSFFVQGSLFLPLFTSLVSGHQLLIQRGYSHESHAKHRRRIGPERQSESHCVISHFLLSSANASCNNQSAFFSERFISSSFKYSQINAGAAYLGACTSCRSMCVRACLFVSVSLSVFELFMRIKCSFGMKCNSLWKHIYTFIHNMSLSVFRACFPAEDLG